MTLFEDDMTSWFASRSDLPSDLVNIGIGDDMAWLNLDERSVLVTTDMLLDGVHFDTGKASYQQVGYKAMAASLSDCAAMATVPRAAVAAVALPRGWGSDVLKGIHEGLIEAGRLFECYLVGGDITAWDKGLAITVTMLSEPGNCSPVRRSAAKAGDTVVVTGKLGGSIKSRHLSFIPRVKEALEITSMVPINAMMDISDGLSTDLNRMCAASGVGAIIESHEIPISDDVLDSDNPLGHALNDGEDFELLFTIKPAAFQKLVDNWRMCTPLRRIGTITAPGSIIEMPSGRSGPNSERGRVQLITLEGKITWLEPGGYDHLGGMGDD